MFNSILLTRLKERFIKVYNLLANLTGCDHNEASIPRRKIKFNGNMLAQLFSSVQFIPLQEIDLF